MRAQINRIVVVVGLLIALPAVAAVGRFRPVQGRRLAVGAIRTISRLCGVRIETAGRRPAEDAQARVLVPNHTSPTDIAAILVAHPQAQFVASAELFRIPLLGAAMRALRTVPIRRDDHASARARVDELAHDSSGSDLVMFPEGGISRDGQVRPFKTGAFVIAIGRAATVVPVAIKGAAHALAPRGRLLVRPATIGVEFLEPLPTAGLLVDDRHALADRARDMIVASLASARPLASA